MDFLGFLKEWIIAIFLFISTFIFLLFIAYGIYLIVR